MNRKIEEKKEIFLDNLKKYKERKELNSELCGRLMDARQNIVDLEEEKEKLRAQRPALLADKKDVTKLNKRLKEIDEEIELNNDTITGVDAKNKDVLWSVYGTLCDTQSAYQDYIQEILNELGHKYASIGKKYADLVKEYITLERLRDGGKDHRTKIGFNFEIPNVNEPKDPLLSGQHHKIYDNNKEKILKKYDIPYFGVSYINHHYYE